LQNGSAGSSQGMALVAHRTLPLRLYRWNQMEMSDLRRPWHTANWAATEECFGSRPPMYGALGVYSAGGDYPTSFRPW